MDAGNLGQTHRSQLGQNIQLSEAAQTSSTQPSEIGRIAQGINAAITKWQSQLHNVLEDWDSTVEQLQAIIDSVKQSVSAYKKVKNEYNAILNDPKRKQSGTSALSNRVYDFTSAQVDNARKVLSFLGIPPSAIHTKNSAPSGYSVAITATQYISMFQLIQQTIVEKAEAGTLLPNKGKIQGEISQLKNEQTRDMFKVMVCFNAIKENEESETGTLQSLQSMVSQMMQAIQ